MEITIGSLFSGIGGFELGLEMAGFGPTLWQVEINDYATKVLEKHWPETERFRDIREVGRQNLERVDLICGGFPCQPFSVAGKRAGQSDDRYLWPEMFRVVRELNPEFVIGENVSGITKMALDQVLSDLESEGYETTTFVIPACGVNAPHRRDRVWILARRKDADDPEGGGCGVRHTVNERTGAGEIDSPSDTDSNAPDTESRKAQPPKPRGLHAEPCGEDTDATDPNRLNGHDAGFCSSRLSQLQTSRIQWNQNWIEVATRLCRMDDGIPSRVDRLKCLGNAVVPKLVYEIGLILRQWIELNCSEE